MPEADVASAELLLSAVVATLPAPKSGKRFARFPETEQLERVWLLDVLPDCTERLLSLLPPGSKQFPDVCLEAAERIEAIRDSGLASEEGLRTLHALVAERPVLRWMIALEIGQSEDIRRASSRLTRGGSCLVSFSKTDLPELTAQANDSSASPETRDIWFEVGINLTFRELNARPRRAALTELSSGPDRESRTQRISVLQSEWLAGLQKRRQSKSKARQHEREKRQAHDRNRENFTHNIEL